MAAVSLHPRFAAVRLREALADSPVVLIHGPRQCGKTTLAQTVGEPRGYGYFSFDNDVARAAARADAVSATGGVTAEPLTRATPLAYPGDGAVRVG